MSYQPTNWKDRVVEKPRTFDVTNNPDGSITLVPKPGVVVQEGTPVNAANMNKIEQGLVSHMADYVPHGLEPAGWIANAVTTLHNDEQGNLVRVDESVGGVLRRRTTLSYSSGNLASVNVKLYAEDGATVEDEWTDTLTYASGQLTKVTRAVIK